jgi:hypothetical protein
MADEIHYVGQQKSHDTAADTQELAATIKNTKGLSFIELRGSTYR